MSDTAHEPAISSNAARRRPTILYIAGWGRSGSTLLDQILGQVDGWFSCGELHFAWWNFSCGCGVPVRECDFWAPVLERALEGQVVRGSEELIRIQNAHLGASPAELIHIRRARFSSASSPHHDYADALVRLYDAIGDAAGASVIVDSSKLATDAYLLSMLTNVDLYLVHLVRDPRATAHSWGRVKLKDPSDPDSYFGRLGPARSSTYWLRRNAVIEALLRPRLGGRYLRLRYEDFIADPHAAVRSILALVGESRQPPFVGPREVELRPNHTVAGNPRRFATGSCVIRPDDEWRNALSGRQRLLATMPAAPLMPRYGYPLVAG